MEVISKTRKGKTMKKILKSLMMFAAAAVTLAGCEKEAVSENETPVAAAEKITVKAAVKSASTRVSVSGADGNYSAVWDDGDAIDIVEFAGRGEITKDTKYQVVAAENIEIADEIAMFEFELAKTEGDGFTYYAVYPGGNSNELVNANYQELVLPMPAEQKPTQESLIDPKANVVIAKAEVDKQGADLLFEESINAAAYARMTIKGLPEGVTPKTVKFENLTKNGNNNVNIAGCYWYLINDETYAAAYGSGAPSATTAITVDQSDAQDVNVVWFGLAPVGKITDFVVVVTDEEGNTYSKTVTGASTPLNFTAGKIINFSVTVNSDSAVTIADINAAGVYTIKDVTVVGNYDSYKSGYILTDSSNEYMFVYMDGAANLPVGTQLSSITGTVGAYNKGLQMTNVEYTENGTTEVSLSEPVEFDYAKATEYIETIATTDQKPTYITYTGKLSVSGTYYNVILDGGDTYQCSLYFNKTEFPNISTYNGKNIIVKGFITAVSSNKYINTCVTSIEPGEEVEEPEPDVMELPYTLDTSLNKGSNSAYDGNGNITVNGIEWNASGNMTMAPWRIGGKSISNVDRAVYTKTAMNADVKAIELTHGAASNITVNSLTVIVSKDADFSNPVSTLKPNFAENETITITKPENVDWNGCYYKFVYNVTVSASSNRFVEFSKVVFTDGTEGGGTTDPGIDPNPDTGATFTINSGDVVSNSGYAAYTKTVDGRGWVITFGGNNYSVGTNSGNRSKCTLSSYNKYAVSPAATTSSIASAFANTTAVDNVSKIEYTYNGGSSQTSTNVYLLYSADNETFSQMALNSGTQGAAIAEKAAFEFEECSGYFAVLFVATNTSGNWRIDNVELTFTYAE